jgi:hypothetical protein
LASKLALLYFSARHTCFAERRHRRGALVTLSTNDLDAETLRRCLRLGGLDIPIERAATLLPVVAALLAGCDRLATLDLTSAGGCGPDGGRGD